jgi:predicted TPR repeat methyltransferase
MLLTAIELNLFDFLSSQKTSEEIAMELKTHLANTGLFLDGLTAVGLLKKRGGCYRNTGATETMLNRSSPAYVGEMLLMTHRMSAETVSRMTQLVQNGPPSKAPDIGGEEIWAGYARVLANYQRSGVARKMAGTVSQIEGFSSFKKMLDLGGGPGLFCIAMVAEHSTMKGTIFDRPAIVKVAEEFIAEYEMKDRITTIGGDYLNDPIGEGYDLIWASATLNFVHGNLTRMVEKIYNALAPGGVFASLSDGVLDERTRPAVYVLSNLAYALPGQDLMFNSGEVAEAMKNVGFASVESTVIATPMMPMELDMARK